jgi:hypothetical protein
LLIAREARCQYDHLDTPGVACASPVSCAHPVGTGHDPCYRSRSQALNRSQIATGSQKHRDLRFLPFAFTEHGAIQAANVLNSPKAIEMGIFVVRAFLRLREMLASNTGLARQFAQLEARLDEKLADHDEAIAAILSAIRQLINPPSPRRRPIGFTADLSGKK